MKANMFEIYQILIFFHRESYNVAKQSRANCARTFNRWNSQIEISDTVWTLRGKKSAHKICSWVGKIKTSACGAAAVDIQIIKVKLCWIVSCNLLQRRITSIAFSSKTSALAQNAIVSHFSRDTPTVITFQVIYELLKYNAQYAHSFQHSRAHKLVCVPRWLLLSLIGRRNGNLRFETL